MRTTDEIRELIERFYDGMTDEAEEKWLKTYFSSGEVAEELKSEKTMFLALPPQTLCCGMAFDG